MVLKLGQPVELNDYRRVALTSHIMKTLERLLVRCMRLQVADDLDPLQFAYQKDWWKMRFCTCCIGHMLIWMCLVHKPPILKDKLPGMGVAPSLTSWIIDSLTS